MITNLQRLINLFGLADRRAVAFERQVAKLARAQECEIDDLDREPEWHKASLFDAKLTNNAVRDGEAEVAAQVAEPAGSDEVEDLDRETGWRTTSLFDEPEQSAGEILKELATSLTSETHDQGSKPPDTAAQATSPGASRGTGEPSVISADLKMIGDLHCAGDIQIKGTVEGDIKSRSVTVSEGAYVHGSIYGDSVHVSGSVKGYIEAPTVTVAKTAKILGDIVHESLTVEVGAFLEGQCRRLDTKKSAEQASVSALKTGAPGAAADTGKRAAGGTTS